MYALPRNQKLRAVVLMLLSSFSFAAMGALIKLAGNLPTDEKAFFRNLISLLVASALLIRRRQSPWGQRANRSFLIARGVFGTIGVIFYFYGIDHLILADSGMLNKMHPFFVAIFAALFLKERLSRHQMCSLLIALGGAMLIIKPSFDFSQSGPAMICFLSAVFAGLAYVFVSYLGDKENSYTIVFYFSLISTLMCFPLALRHFVTPGIGQLALLLGAGGAAAVGQFSLTVAYRLAPAGEVSIYNYSNVIFSSLLGIVFFAELPDGLSLAGYLLIIAAGYIIFRFGAVKKPLMKAEAAAH
ncbi:MAG: DMT family transporter [Kiritimatiellales bacterium]